MCARDTKTSAISQVQTPRVCGGRERDRYVPCQCGSPIRLPPWVARGGRAPSHPLCPPVPVATRSYASRLRTLPQPRPCGPRSCWDRCTILGSLSVDCIRSTFTRQGRQPTKLRFLANSTDRLPDLPEQLIFTPARIRRRIANPMPYQAASELPSKT